MIKVVLFDLDGTLLPMDQDIFVKAYFGGIVKKAESYGYEASDLINTIMAGTTAMVNNRGTKTNEQIFWDFYENRYGKDALKDKVIFDKFYENEFELVKKVCGYNSQAKVCVDVMKKMGYRIALATNPIFPEIATKARVRWAGFNIEDFETFTSYENSRRCKPSLDYYRDVISNLSVYPEECLMVGNDVEEDMVAEQLGMKVYLLTDCLINNHNKDISKYPNGNFDDLMDYIKSI